MLSLKRNGAPFLWNGCAVLAEYATLKDRYGFLYEKEISDVKEKGRTEVKLTEKDKVKQKGDWKRKIDQIFNGD